MWTRPPWTQPCKKGIKIKGLLFEIENMEYKKNPDGTDMLDENGQKVPVTDKKEIESAKVTPEDETKKIEQDKANLVEEIKDLRLKYNLTKTMLDELKESRDKKEKEVNPKELTEEEKVSLLIEKKLKEKEALDAQANKKAAFEKFVTENKEFSPDNDSTGFKRDALQKKFNRFNTDGISTVEEFLDVIREAKILLMKDDNSSETSKETQNPYSNPGKINNSIENHNDKELSPEEITLMKKTGKTREQIIKIKKNHPELIEDLLQYVRD